MTWCDSCEERPADGGILCRDCRAIARELDGLADVVTGFPEQLEEAR